MDGEGREGKEMFICGTCAELNRVFGISRSFGPCELCQQTAPCFDIPSSAINARTAPYSFITGVGQILANVHPKDKCQGWCVIHNPAPGPWDAWPTQWRGDQVVKIETIFGPIWMPVDVWRGFERNCPHGIGHTAVEEVLRGNGHPHGCDGCPCGPQHIQATGYDPKAV